MNLLPIRGNLRQTPFIRSLYRRIPLEFYGTISKDFMELFGALWAIIIEKKFAQALCAKNVEFMYYSTIPLLSSGNGLRRIKFCNCERPYHSGTTGSHSTTAVKHCR